MRREEPDHPCSACDGTGLVEYLAGSFGGYPGSPDYREAECEECGGTGEAKGPFDDE